MMEQLGKSALAKTEPYGPLWLWAAFYTLVFVHGCLVIGIIFSFFILPFMAPWYLALPLCTFIWFFSTSQFNCKSTEAENHLRVRLGMKRIGGFVGHYFVRPLKVLLARHR